MTYLMSNMGATLLTIVWLNFQGMFHAQNDPVIKPVLVVALADTKILLGQLSRLTCRNRFLCPRSSYLFYVSGRWFLAAT